MQETELYLLDRLARAVQRGPSMTRAQRLDLAEFVDQHCSRIETRTLAGRLVDCQLSWQEVLDEANRVGGSVDLDAFRASLALPVRTEVGGLSFAGGAVVVVSELSVWEKFKLWMRQKLI